MKDQIALAVLVPTTIVDLQLDFHGLAINILKFDVSKLNGESNFYLSVDKYGDVTMYQYMPEVDWNYEEFEAGSAPENALDTGYVGLVAEIDLDAIPVMWSNSVIKYAIVEEIA